MASKKTSTVSITYLYSESSRYLLGSSTFEYEKNKLNPIFCFTATKNSPEYNVIKFYLSLKCLTWFNLRSDSTPYRLLFPVGGSDYDYLNSTGLVS